MSNRRIFLKQTAAIGGAIGLSPLANVALQATVPRRRPNPGRAPTPLNILILGGTGFTGPEQVDYALARGHRVTLFNRGKTRLRHGRAPPPVQRAQRMAKSSRPLAMSDGLTRRGGEAHA